MIRAMIFFIKTFKIQLVILVMVDETHDLLLKKLTNCKGPRKTLR